MLASDLPEAVVGAGLEEEVRLAKQRDREVWAAWHDAYYPLVYRYAFIRLRNQEDAEDIAAQVFLEALRGIDRFTYKGRPVIAWLYGIAHNLVLKRRRELARSPTLPADGGPEPASEGDEDAAVQRLLVWSTLDRLKEEHREVLVLRYLLDLPARDVARMINKTEPATYSLLFRALEAARHLLTADSRQARRSVTASPGKAA